MAVASLPAPRGIGSSCLPGSPAYSTRAARSRGRSTRAGLIVGCALVASGFLGYAGALVAHGQKPAQKAPFRPQEPAPTTASHPLGWALAQWVVAAGLENSRPSAALLPESADPSENATAAPTDELTPESESSTPEASTALDFEPDEALNCQADPDSDPPAEDASDGSYQEDGYHHASYYRRHAPWSSYAYDGYSWPRARYAGYAHREGTRLLPQAAMAAEWARPASLAATGTAQGSPISGLGRRPCRDVDRRWLLKAQSGRANPDPASAAGLVCVVDLLSGAGPSDLLSLLRRLVRPIGAASEPSRPIALLNHGRSLGWWVVPQAPNAASLARDLQGAGFTEMVGHAPAIVSAVTGVPDVARPGSSGPGLSLRVSSLGKFLSLLARVRDTAGIFAGLGFSNDRERAVETPERPLPASLVPASLEIEPAVDECSSRAGVGEATQPVARATCVGNASFLDGDGSEQEVTALFELMAPRSLST
jgi:hypothetical protein